MNYFIHYKLFPALAKYRITSWYAGTMCGFLCCFLFWLYVIDAPLKKAALFYETSLIAIQKKDGELLKKKTSLLHLKEQQENLVLNINSTKKAVDIVWDQATDIFTSYAQKNHLIIDTISITQQTAKDSYRKKNFSLTLQGSLEKTLFFLEDMQKNTSLILENFSLYVEPKNTWKINLVYSVQKIKNPSTLNKLKG